MSRYMKSDLVAGSIRESGADENGAKNPSMHADVTAWKSDNQQNPIDWLISFINDASIVYFSRVRHNNIPMHDVLDCGWLYICW